MRFVILLLLLPLSACRGKPRLDPELVRLRAEQRELRARTDALQARIDQLQQQQTAPPTNQAPSPPEGRVRPLLTNIGTPETGAIVTSTRPSEADVAPVVAQPAVAAPSTPTSLHTEDLHGLPPSITSPTSPGGSGPSAQEGAALLEQLNAQMKTLQKSQSQEQSALDQIEGER